MSPPRPLVVVSSVHHGNTAAVAHAIADALGPGADVTAAEDVPLAMLDECDLVGFGSGVYYGRMHPALFGLLRGLPDASAPARRAFVFSTSGLPFLSKLWHRPLKTLLARKGFDVVGEFSCRGFDTWGPLWFAGGLNRKHPDGRDLARAREFAARMVAGATPGADQARAASDDVRQRAALRH